MDYEDLLQFQSQNMPYQLLALSISNINNYLIYALKGDSQNLQQIKQIQGKKIKQIDFTCDYELQEQELKLIEQIIRLIKAQNEILYFVIQNCEWNKELQQFIQNISDLKVSFEIKQILLIKIQDFRVFDIQFQLILLLLYELYIIFVLKLYKMNLNQVPKR
ncbi:hypothetical protein ABPG72_002822 [Tetrahymena utriculariae]